MNKSDVLIIGGSSIGLNSAYALLKAGHSVRILEAKKIGQGNTAGNAGHIVPSHIVPLAAPGMIWTVLKWMSHPSTSPFGMRLSLDPTYLHWLASFAWACSEANVARGIQPLYELGQLSATLFSKMIREEGFSCDYKQTGLLYLYKNSKAFAKGQTEAEFFRQHGIPANVLVGSEVQALEPAANQTVLGGVHFTGDANLHPGQFLNLLGERVRAMGADVVEEAPVSGFEVRDGIIRSVQSTAGEFKADEVVLAGGVWSPEIIKGLKKLKIPVQAARGYGLTAKAPEHSPKHALILAERNVAVSPLGRLLRLTGRLELSKLDLRIQAKRIAQIEQAGREYLRLEKQLEIEETWAGLRPTTPDGMPIIGRARHYRNLVIATGHAMLGLSLGPGTGQVVAEFIAQEQTTVNVKAFEVDRF